jgi:hypothetical protein
MEAQRFPADYDGILAGAPANFWTHMLAAGVDISQAIYTDPAGYISSIKFPAIAAAVLAACDEQDGVRDGILNDPTRCHFDPATLLCKDVDSRAAGRVSQETLCRRTQLAGRAYLSRLLPRRRRRTRRLGSLAHRQWTGWQQQLTLYGKLFPLHGVRRSYLESSHS